MCAWVGGLAACLVRELDYCVLAPPSNYHNLLMRCYCVVVNYPDAGRPAAAAAAAVADDAFIFCGYNALLLMEIPAYAKLRTQTQRCLR